MQHGKTIIKYVLYGTDKVLLETYQDNACNPPYPTCGYININNKRYNIHRCAESTHYIENEYDVFEIIYQLSA